MDFLAFLLLSLAIAPASFTSPPTVIDVDDDQKDIPEINKGLNLREGDIMEDPSKQLQRSAILLSQYRWNRYIPYVLNGSLSLNYKGVILRAFEQLRLKACIDFKPRTTEQDYVSVESQSGCWSYIGKIGGRQQLSIGNGCGYIGIVEHEFLHALGFYHEQSRYDRDNYVTIIYENIIAGYASNFEKASEQISTIQGTPYDYTSVMHYGQDAFTNGSGHTIITKVPQFQDVIGQRYDLSPLDVLELSKLYKCNSTISFLDRCSFDNDMCQMATCSSTANGWKMASNVSGGPFSDHSNLASIGVPAVSMNTTSSGPSFFMHFSTKTGKEGDSGRLASKEMTPRRDCHVQCLQFFYYHSGNETDQLNIWIREYQNDIDTKGTLRLMDQITGPPTDHWQLRYVPLNAEKPFLVEFEARKGAGYSSGGFSVDDINLSESECPHNVWQLRNFMELWNKSAPGTYIFSPAYYSPDGYRYQVLLRLIQDRLSIFVRLVSGVYDDQLQWPCPWRQVTFLLLDQNPDIQQRMSNQASLTTDPTMIYGGKYVWGKPSDVGTLTVINGNETVNATDGWGYSMFLEKGQLDDREFVKGGDLILLISMQDVSALQQNNSLPCPKVPAKTFSVSPYQGAQEGSCTTQITPPTMTTTTTKTTTTTPRTTTFTKTTTDEDKECLDIFCSGANIVHPSVALLLAFMLLVVN
ncbi:meprin A subunit beta-like [Colossoma macropomum]|uniref:meprin A subunit beta-like n=1 Tax=Colossoma macropomum TaxID=42526 RepID=UPI00186540C8|nr:meprin A subunit beta-like [Colossoma macropomum]XP_036449032.1 meprin A subunit beta-like [Colossoma macropomum]XP_036449040.1 meprin A subunit beta-like [Colossoma macropomum]